MDYENDLETIMRTEQRAARKVRCRKTYDYLVSWIEDRDSRDQIKRQVWWEQYHILKRDCWWTFRKLEHWLRDRDHKNAQKPRGDFTGNGILASGIEYLLNPPVISHRAHRGVGGVSSGCTGLRTEGAPVHYDRKIGEWSPGGDNIPGEIRELQDFGYVEYGYGKWTRLVQKEGKYGKFLSLESGDTIAGKDEDGKTKTETRTKSWFNLPSGDVELHEIIGMMQKAADELTMPPK
jgi:hypothetical protein